MQTTAYADGTPHELALSSLEKQTIKYAKQNCKNVVVVINSSNIMELGDLMSGEYEADAILWIGGPGCAGMQSLAPGSISYYGLAPWEVGLIIGNVVIYTFAVCSVGWMVYRAYDEKKHPERYNKGKKEKDAE